jgi:hypothetical protein
MQDKSDEQVEYAVVPRPEGVEERSLGQLAAQALESGVIGAAGTLGALGAKDAYGKAKGALQSKDEGSKVVLPPGTDVER